MAIVSDFLTSKLVTRLNYGIVNGKELTKKKSYPNVKETATIEAIHAMGTTIASLQQPVLEDVYRVTDILILDDGQ